MNNTQIALLVNLKVANLACFDGSHEIQFAPETVIIGPNNVGKSAFISAINAMRCSPAFGRGFSWDSLNLYRWGSFENIVYGHDKTRSLQISADITGKTPSGATYGGTVSLDATERTLTIRPQHSAVSQAFKEGLGTIWYLGPSRIEVPKDMQVGSNVPYTPWAQPINPDGSNVVTFLLERFTSRDKRWDVAESWLMKITPEMSFLKSPMRGNVASIETTDSSSGEDVNLAYQGTGIQKALAVVAALVFSPPETTIIVEEPEVHLHPRSQEVLVDLINTSVNKWNKQVIFTTHSFNMLRPFIYDLGNDTVGRRGSEHERAKTENCRIMEFTRAGAGTRIAELPFAGASFQETRDHLQNLWG